MGVSSTSGSWSDGDWSQQSSRTRRPPCGDRYLPDRLRARRSFFAATSEGKWANVYNIGTILQVTATLGLMSMGVALVIATGEIDISVGSTFGIGALIYLWLACGSIRLRDVRRGRGRDADRRLQRAACHSHRHPFADHHARNADDLPGHRDCVDRRLLLLRSLRRARVASRMQCSAGRTLVTSIPLSSG